MELIKEYKDVKNVYTKKIKIIKYTEGENITVEKEGVKDICEIIISQNDNEYPTLQKQEREKYIVSKKLEIADNFKKNEKFSKSFTSKLVQSGLQSKNVLSSILYMNELYKVNTVIYNDNTKKFYITTYMKYPILICEYKNNSWHYIEKESLDENTTYGDIKELSSTIKQDTSLMIFKSDMLPLSKYKVKQLEDMCNENNIDILQDGKKKLKKQLYDELTIHMMTSP